RGPGSRGYQSAGSGRVRGVLDADALEQSLRAVVRRHDPLRTSFVMRDGRLPQVVAPTLALEVPLIDLPALPEGERDGRARELAVAEAREPFDLTRGPLLRARLVRLGAEDHLLLLTVHHIAADGWSMRLLVRDLAEL